MGRFLLFGGTGSGTKGGFYDYLRAFDELSDAKRCGYALQSALGNVCDWWHVWDAERGLIVAKGEDGRLVEFQSSISGVM